MSWRSSRRGCWSGLAGVAGQICGQIARAGDGGAAAHDADEEVGELVGGLGGQRLGAAAEEGLGVGGQAAAALGVGFAVRLFHD